MIIKFILRELRYDECLLLWLENEIRLYVLYHDDCTQPMHKYLFEVAFIKKGTKLKEKGLNFVE